MIVSRFAPAPTGFLHLGHVVNALHVWGITRALGGRVLLRIENHDAQRSRAEYERAILDDLDWLGCVPDEPSTDAFRAGTCRGRQSDRHDIYGSALATLLDAGRPAALQIQSGCSADLQVRRAWRDLRTTPPPIAHSRASEASPAPGADAAQSPKPGA